MKKMQLGLIGFTAVLLFVPSIVRGATITAGIDGQNFDVPIYYESYGVGAALAGKYEIGYDGVPGFSYDVGDAEGDGGRVVMSGEMDPDPTIAFGITAVDFGLPSSFTFSFVLPLAPLVSNPSTVFDSLSGSVTKGAAAGFVTVTPTAPPAFIPTDGDGIDELQVYTLSDDGGTTWKNVGLDAGPLTAVGPLAGLGSGLYGAYNQGPIPTIAGGAWTHMRVDINFSLSGGGDTFTLNGAKVLVPEPGALLLGMMASVLGWLVRRR